MMALQTANNDKSMAADKTYGLISKTKAVGMVTRWW